MRALLELFTAGFRRGVRYRAAVLASLIANVTFGLIRGSLIIAAVHAADRPIAGYDVMTAATYVWISQGLLGPVDIWGASASEIGNRVKTGDFATDLLRPLHPVMAWWATDLGRAASQLLPRFVPMLTIGWLVTGLDLATDPASWLLFGLSLVLATTCAFLFWTLVNLGALWWIEMRGQRTIASVVAQALSGFLVPVQWFPDWAATLARWSPFPSMWQAPTDMLTGLAEGRVVVILTQQVVWVTVLGALAALVLRLGARKLEVQGG